MWPAPPGAFVMDDRLDQRTDLGDRSRRVEGRNGAQQRLEVRIVPGFHAARRKAGGLEVADQRVAGGQNRAVARQVADGVVIGFAKRGLGDRKLHACLHVHGITP